MYCMPYIKRDAHYSKAEGVIVNGLIRLVMQLLTGHVNFNIGFYFDVEHSDAIKGMQHNPKTTLDTKPCILNVGPCVNFTLNFKKE